MKGKQIKRFVAVMITICLSFGLINTDMGRESVEASGYVAVSDETGFGIEGKVSYPTSKTTSEDITVTVVESGEYMMTGDVTLSRPLYIPDGNSVTIILNNCTLSRNLTEAAIDGTVIINLGTLTLGSAESTEGVITGGNTSKHWYDGMETTSLGGAIQVGAWEDSGTLTNYVTISGNNAVTGGGVKLSGYDSRFTNYGIIANNSSSSGGGGVSYLPPTVIRDGENPIIENKGIIENNTAKGYGGGIYTSRAIIYNSGIIRNNKITANVAGGGIYSSKDIYLQDGTVITGNTAFGCGGGIYAGGNVYVSDEIIVSGNYVSRAINGATNNPANLCLVNTSNKKTQIIIQGELTEDSKIGVHVTEYGNTFSTNLAVITEGYGDYVHGNQIIVMDEFHSYKTDGLAHMFMNEDNELVIDVHTHNWVPELNGNILETYCTSDYLACEYYATDLSSATNTLKATLNATDSVYNNKAYKNAKLSQNIRNVIKDAVVGRIYYEGIENTDYDKSSTAPTMAGKYRASAVITVNSNDYELIKDFEITKSKIAKPQENTSSFIYNAAEQKYYLSTNSAYTITNDTRTVTGEQLVTVTLNDTDNTEWADGTNTPVNYLFKINPANQNNIIVNMNGYTFGEEVPMPSCDGEIKENPDIKYYYSSTDTNADGNEWKNILGDTLLPGTYYMYAVLSATDNYNSFTTNPVAFTVEPLIMADIVVENVEKHTTEIHMVLM